MSDEALCGDGQFFDPLADGCADCIVVCLVGKQYTDYCCNNCPDFCEESNAFGQHVEEAKLMSDGFQYKTATMSFSSSTQGDPLTHINPILIISITAVVILMITVVLFIFSVIKLWQRNRKVSLIHKERSDNELLNRNGV